ncbi:MAG: radical SAM protein [Candidatus Omnitrophota bacterium]
MKLLLVWPNKDSFGFKPIGISLLAGIARQLGWETKLFDTTGIDFGYTDNTQFGQSVKMFKPVDPSSYNLKKEKLDLKEEFKKAFSEFRPDCVAIGVLSDEFRIAAQISAAAKEAMPDIPIIWGNKYPTLNPEKTLLSHNADFVCIGEGLRAFPEFLKAMAGGGDLYSIPNIWGNKKGSIVKNAPGPLVKDIDAMPYVDWEIFDKRQFYKPFDGRIYVGGDHMLNWGCPYHCTYCINHFYHGLYSNKYVMRRYSVKRILPELKHLVKRYGLQFFKFHDEDFLMRPVDNLRELGEAYRDEIGLPFTIETNPKSVTEEKVRILKEMNCASASIAIETGDLHLRRDVLKRVDTEEDVIRAFSLFRDAGIRTVSFNMLGIPFETRKTYYATVELNRNAGVQYPQVGLFFPFEGTELREIAIRENLFDPDEGSLYDRDNPPMKFPNLSKRELMEMRNVFPLYVKLPKSFWPFIERSEIQDDAGRMLRKEILDVYDKTVWSNNGWYDGGASEEMYLGQLAGILSKGS